MAEVTVAAVAFRVVNDVEDNLTRLLATVDEAAAAGVRLVHFPEFCNHPAWYRDRDHAWDVALDEGSDFVTAIQNKARERQMYIGFNVTIRGQRPDVYITNHLVSPRGEILAQTRKQVLMYTEWDFFRPSPSESVVVDTDIGRIGLYSCMDGLVPETSRVLAVKGAQILLNSLSSNALDEATIHIPVRAAENGVWVIAANRGGPLVDPADMEELEKVTGIPQKYLMAGAAAQILAPDGEPLTRGEPWVEGMVIATIDPEAIGSGDDLSAMIADRRPDTYAVMAQPNQSIPYARSGRPDPAAEVSVTVAQIGRDPESGPARNADSVIQNARRAVRLARTDIVVLPELFPFTRERPANDVKQAALDSESALLGLQQAATEMHCWIATSLIERDGDRYYNTAYLMGPEGLAGSYRQVHVHQDDRAWATPGDEFRVFETPLGSIGLMTGYDGVFPESARVLARLGADLILYPTTWRLPWEVSLGFMERAAENHVSIVAAARIDSPVQAGSLIASLSPLDKFPISGEVNMPDRIDAVTGNGETITATLDLRLSRDKRLMGRTDVLMDVRPDLYGSLVQERERVSVRRQAEARADH